MSKRNILIVGALLALASGSPPALAGGDAAAGRDKAAACLACHQPGSFAGKSEADLAAAITAIAAAKVAHPPVGTLSADDVANLAAFFAAAPTG